MTPETITKVKMVGISQQDMIRQNILQTKYYFVII